MARRAEPKSFKADKLEEIIRSSFSQLCLTIEEELLANVAGTTLIFKVEKVASVPVHDNLPPVRRGILTSKTVITFTRSKDSPITISGTTSTAPMAFGPQFNYESIGIGGLDREFANIFRRAFASRVYPPEVIKSLGVKHVKGMLLYGPPGTGKTLIARKIGQMLNAREPKLVNGPEVLNKFVGQSEENIRNLFADAESEYRSRGDESELHIIIFDEIDAICKARGSNSTGGTGVGDSIVNQLLSKIDGVEELNNILVIGMTNRKDLIDEALLRPGRFEVHVEIGLPDESGRVQILNIHTSQLRNSKHIDPTISLEELAKVTRNFSGSELEGLVRSATSFALNRNVDMKTNKPDINKLLVTSDDFQLALKEIIPAYGISEDYLNRAVRNGFVHYSEEFELTFTKCKLYIEQLRASTKTNIFSMVIKGEHRSGKTAFAAQLAIESQFPFVRFLSPDNFIGYSESARVAKIVQAFEEAYKSNYSVVIVDDLERFLDWARVGPRYSNAMLQAFMVLFRKEPPLGRKLLVIATTSESQMFRILDMENAFDASIQCHNLFTGNDICQVLRAHGTFTDADFAQVRALSNCSLPIKQAILLAETAIQEADFSGDEQPGSLGRHFVNLVSAYTNSKVTETPTYDQF